jgi:hypothetical protein
MNIHQKSKEISAEEISKTLDKFGSGPPYHEFQTRASRRRGRQPEHVDMLLLK